MIFFNRIVQPIWNRKILSEESFIFQGNENIINISEQEIKYLLKRLD